MRLENFRDLDFHFVTPIVIQADHELALSLTCTGGRPSATPPSSIPATCGRNAISGTASAAGRARRGARAGAGRGRVPRPGALPRRQRDPGPHDRRAARPRRCLAPPRGDRRRALAAPPPGDDLARLARPGQRPRQRPVGAAVDLGERPLGRVRLVASDLVPNDDEPGHGRLRPRPAATARPIRLPLPGGDRPDGRVRARPVDLRRRLGRRVHLHAAAADARCWSCPARRRGSSSGAATPARSSRRLADRGRRAALRGDVPSRSPATAATSPSSGRSARTTPACTITPRLRPGHASRGTTTLVSAGPGGAAGSQQQPRPGDLSRRPVGRLRVGREQPRRGRLQRRDRRVRADPPGRADGARSASRPAPPPNGPSNAPSISANGTIVAFESGAQNLVAGRDARRSRGLRPRSDGGADDARVDRRPTAPRRRARAARPSISGDGRIVAFASVVPDLVALGDNAILAAAAPAADGGLRPRPRVGRDDPHLGGAGGGPAGRVNAQPTVGGNGRFVAFASNSANLVRGDGNQVSDVFLRDLPPVPSVAPNPVDFGARAVGADGPPIAAVVTNSGWGPLSGPRPSIGPGRRPATSRSSSTAATAGPPTRRVVPDHDRLRAGRDGRARRDPAVDHNGPKSPLTAALHGSGSNAEARDQAADRAARASS